MSPELKHTEVLIVGAGPSGLMMAAQLLRNGIQPVIIDSKQGPTDKSKALGVQARSLEVYRQLGIADKMISDGYLAEGAFFYYNGKKTATFPLSEIGRGQTLYPYLFVYPQSKNERALLNYLTEQCCPVYWNTTLAGVEEKADKVITKLKDATGETELTCNWLIGADGANSAVRKMLNIGFTGDTYQHRYFLADMKGKEGNNFINLFLNREGFMGFLRLSENEYRILGNLPEKLAEKEDLQPEDIWPFVEEISGGLVTTKSYDWFTTYRLHHKMAEKFRTNRCFLIGDAAHIHSPIGGQGMNTGLQDAHNLAWKLSGVIKQTMQENILNSYANERMPIAKQLLKTTDRAFSIIMSNNWVAGFIKKNILPRVLSYVWNNEKLKQHFFKNISQININYRHSAINLHISHATKVKAGDRLPYMKIYDEKQQQETDLHQWCAKPGFTLMVLGRLSEHDLFTIAKWLNQTYAETVNFFYLPYSYPNHMVFELFEIKSGHKKSLIVRPDMHIGFMNDVVDIEMMDNYLTNTAGLVKNNRK
jgi:2-polyprenyl-6-methoxyphenol hydroxylase-like FAD-dependent oxidoreductase